LTIDMTLVMERNGHLGDEQFESYSIGNLGEQDVVSLEEHVLFVKDARTSWPSVIRGSGPSGEKL